MLRELLSLVMAMPGAGGTEVPSVPAAAVAPTGQRKLDAWAELLSDAERKAFALLMLDHLVWPVLLQPTTEAAIRSLHQRDRYVSKMRNIIALALERQPFDQRARVQRRLLRLPTAQLMPVLEQALGRDQARNVLGMSSKISILGLQLVDRFAEQTHYNFEDLDALHTCSTTLEAVVLVLLVGSQLVAEGQPLENLRSMVAELELALEAYCAAADRVLAESEQERQARDKKVGPAEARVLKAWEGRSMVEEYLTTKGETDDA